MAATLSHPSNLFSGRRSYSARRNALSKEKAQQYGEALYTIQEESGGALQTEVVVERAEPEDSPLHDYFEWTDKIAGHQYRLWQARQLINIIQVEYEETGHTEPAYINVIIPPVEEGDNSHHIYVPAYTALSSTELRAQVLGRAFHDVRYWQQKYEHYSELAGVFSAIDRAEAQWRAKN